MRGKPSDQQTNAALSDGPAQRFEVTWLLPLVRSRLQTRKLDPFSASGSVWLMSVVGRPIPMEPPRWLDRGDQQGFFSTRGNWRTESSLDFCSECQASPPG